MGDIFSCISRNQTEEDVTGQQCEHHEHNRLQEEVDARCEQSELELKQRLAENETLYRKKVDELRSALNKKEEELKSFKDRLQEEVDARCEQRELELKQRMAEMETFYRKKVDEMRLQREADVKSEDENKERMAEMEKFYKKKVDYMRMAAEITVSVRQDTKHPNIPVSKTPAEMEMLYKEKLDEMSSALKRKDDELKSVKHRMAEMETFYKKKVDEMRPAEEVFFSMMGDTESMNNPVSKTRLTEMYTKLKLVQWPKVKDHLKSKNMNPTTTKALVQKMFKSASEEMEKKKKQIEDVFILIESSSGISPQKVKQYIQLANHNLQMSLYHSSKEDLLKNIELEGQYPHDVMIKLRFMASECYWIGCLMALNNPPLYPDWKSHIPGMDAWNIFPRDIKPHFDM
ncbi:unnamed protein product [Oreochromis niloticus]|nr:unnamed protein product [Mustela putorius furo]